MENKSIKQFFKMAVVMLLFLIVLFSGISFVLMTCTHEPPEILQNNIIEITAIVIIVYLIKMLFEIESSQKITLK